MELGKLEHTQRGFETIEFKDHYNHPCALTMSSLAEYEQPGISAVWLGPTEAKPLILASHASKFGVKTSETSGWVDYPIPDEVLLTTQMHLNRKQVEALIGHLSNWLETGHFSPEVAKN